MSALISDVITGSVTPDVVNSAVNAGGKLLKMVEMELRFGKTVKKAAPSLPLCE